MQITDRSQPRAPQTALDPERIAFGTVFTPNMFICEYRDDKWSDARIEPVQTLSLHPGALVFHYAQSIFEGMKAFRQPDGSVSLFRPEMNARRFRLSAARMCMPLVEEDFFLKALAELIRVEEPWVVSQPGSLYLRPVLMGNEASIGVRASREYLFFILALPSGAYFPETPGGLGAVNVLISDSVVRAAPGQTGGVKTAANYAVTLKAISEARNEQCAQVLFLDASPERRVEEMGGMNIMFVEAGELVTPPLNGTILPGVIRDSILQLASDAGLRTRQYGYTRAELLAKLKSGTIQEAFACGTAATITAVRRFRAESGEELALEAPGPITRKLYQQLVDVQYGHAPDRHSWLQSVVKARELVSR